MAQIVFLALLGSFFTPLAVDASIQIWSGTITYGSWGNAFENGNATGYGYDKRNNAGSISNPIFTYRGTTYTIEGFGFAKVGNNSAHKFVLTISQGFPECDKELLSFGDFQLSDALNGSAYGSHRYSWQGRWAIWEPIGRQRSYTLILHPTTPDAPIVSALNEGSQVLLSWTTPCDGGIDITGHEYREKVGDGSFGPWEPIPNSAASEVNATSYTVTTLNDPSEYTFEIQAVNALGEGEISAEAVVSNRPAVPLSDRTPQVRDAIVDAVPGISDYLSVTEAHLAAITILRLGYQSITALKPGDFSGLTALTRLYLPGNQLSSLPDSIFEGLTALTLLGLGRNSVHPLPLTVSLEKVGEGQFKAIAPSGAPFEIVLPITVANGSISGGATTITVPAGSLESQPLTVTRTPGTTFAVTVDISSLPRIPANHFGYTLVKSADLPIAVTEGDIPGTSVLTLTVGENPNDPFNDYPFGRIGYNQHPSPGWNFGTLSSPAFVINGVFYTVTSLYYLTYSKQLTLRTSPALPRGFVLYLGSQQFNSVDSGFIYRYSGDGWGNVNLNWSVGHTVQVRIVETTPILLGPPTNLQATTQNENIMLTWELPANSDPTTLPVNEYEVRISTDGGTTSEYGWRELHNSGPGQENRNGITIGSNRADVYRILSNGTEYTFEIRALGGDGFGDAASETLVFDGITGITPLSHRTREVRDAIVAAVPGISDYRNVTRAHLATIRSLSFQSQYIGTLRTGDFDGLTALAHLNLAQTQLYRLPADLFEGLSSLTTLYLNDNRLRGTIPAELGSLANLQQLRLQNNQLSGAIPAELGNLDNLQELRLSGNQLSGAIPAELGNLASLQYLNLRENQLSGAIPAELGNLASLQYLNLRENQLSGAIPAELGNLASLLLFLSGNQFSGCIPEGLRNLSSNDLPQLGLSFCDEGPRAALVALYHATNGNNWTNNTNWLSDEPIGQWYGITTDEAGRVTHLTLRDNNLVGTIPAELGNLANLQWLSLRSNQLSGAIPAELANLANLQDLWLPGNQLSGAIPAELGNLDNLTTLVLSDNQLSGSIPASLGNLANLQRLYLENNQLSGAIPAELGNLDNLQRLRLSNNQLSGAIPAELGNLANLQRLYLENNQLSGAIPPELGNLANLQRLGLFNNQLSGCIPEGLRNVSRNDLPQLGLFFCGEAPSPDRAALVALYNATDGDNWTNNTNWLSDRPIGQWHGITTDEARRVTHLTLTSNNLVGTIPAELANLANLQSLYLDSNQLSGAIPAELANLANLQELWLGDTQLCVPTDAAFQAWLSGIGSKSGVVNCGLGDAAVSASPDSLALVALYNATDGANWTNNTNWLSDEPIGEWHGVTTDANGRVTTLNLGQNQLSGVIPAELGNLANLTILGLTDNQLSGTIPSELGNLANLTTLFLNSNQLSGVIPAELGNLSNLTWLALSQNQLSGSILSALGTLSNLTTLDLRENELSGVIPPELGNLANLTILGLSDNQLSGAIPPQLGSLSNLEWLLLRENELSGAIPASLGNLANLTILHLSDNQLSGAIPPQLGNLANLTQLGLADNQLSGAIPPQLGSLANLTRLGLADNQLSGAIPPQLGNLANLQYLHLYSNQLSGSIPAELANLANLQELWLGDTQLCVPTDAAFQAWLSGIGSKSGVVNCGLGDAAVSASPDSLALVALYNATDGDNWTNNANWLSDEPIGQWHGVTTDANGRVATLDLVQNQLSGVIPPELGNLANLTQLGLIDNQLSGTIPAELGNLANLTTLGLGSNQLSGVIPPELGTLSNLTWLALSQNQLSGSILSALGTLSNLTTLDLRENELSGVIPPELGNLANLTILGLSDNQLSGTIPPQLGSLSNLEWLLLRENELSGAIPASLGNLANLQTLGLGSNQLSGAIPPQLGNLSNLTQLGLADNQLSGSIPPELANLSNLTQLLLDGNQLSGEIPAWLGNLSNLTTLWLHNNQLSGLIPSELGNLANLEQLYLGGNQLSGSIPPELGNLANLTILYLDSNPGLSGPLPGSFTGLSALGILVLGDTQLCAPTDAAFQAWLSRIGDKSGVVNCGLGDAAVSASPDSLALVALYNATDGDNWTNNTNWLSDEPIAEWYGVTTDATGRVTRLALSQNELSGTIPSELGALSDLTELSLYNNQLSGSIPAELGNLANLKYLQLGGNQLSGTIPPQLGNLANLQSLQLAGNQLSGSIPAELGNLANLIDLTLSANQLSGSIPAELGNLANLKYLQLGGNQLSGTIPPQLANLANLQWLNLPNNQFSGSIPPELGNLSNLRELRLHNNQLSGSIPPELGNLSNLIILGLGVNQLSGPILPQLGNLSNLTQLGLADNQLSGPIPAELANLANLRWLSLEGNQLSGAIPAELANLANLQSLHLYSNQLSGAIPAELANLANLQELWLGDTQLCVPTDAAFQAWLSGIGSKSGVVNCGLGDAAVSASPDSLALVVLYNATDGANWTDNANWLSDKPIGEWHGVTTDEAGRVTYLTLLGNNLVGTLPAELENLSNLLSLLLSGNQLSGTIPPQLGSLSNLKWLLLRENELSGAIPASLGNLANLQILDLSSNQLSGAIPAELANLSNLMQLGLADNQLSGAIPASLGNLANLQILDLSSNQLSGAIPAELANLVNLQRLGLSGNQLSGCIPDGLQAVSSNDFAQLGLLFCGAAVSPPTVEITRLVSTPASLPEDAGATTITLTATLAAASATADTIRFALVAPTTGPEAIRDTDYAATLGAVVPLAAGATEATTTLTLTPIDNNEADGDRFLGVQASIAGSSAQTDIKISDDEGPSTKITLTTNPTEIREDAGATEVRVTAALDGNVLAEDVTLQLVLASNATATRDLDYTAILGRLTIPAGKEQGMTTISITPTDDGVADGAEQIILTSETALTNEDGDPIAIEAATITLQDTGEHVEPPPPSDTTPTFAGTVADLSATVGAPIASVALPVATGNDPMTYVVSTLPAGLSFDPATRTLSGTPTAAGTTTVTYTVIDGDAESPESAAQTFTIAVAEAPASTVEIAGLVATPASLREDAGATTITLTATLTAASATAATIRFALVAPTTGPAAIRDTDYTATLAAVVPLAAGATEATTTLTLTPIDNNEADGDRSLGMQASIAGSSAQIDIKISDDEGPSTSIALSVNPAEISEQDGLVNVEVTAALDGAPLSENAIVTLSINPASTASRDIDYSVVFDPQIQIPSGSTMGSTQLEIQPVADGEAEGDETIKLIGVINGLMGDEAEITLSDQAVPEEDEQAVPPEETDDSPLTFADDTAIADGEYTAGTPIDPLVLPEASGGTGQLTYSVSTLPAGLVFDPATRTISGTPTAATDGAVTVAYTATDEAGTAVVLTFSITVNPGLSFGDLFD